MAELILRDLTWRIVRGALDVHRSLGPGLLEGTYLNCLEHELRTSGLRVAREVGIPVHYKGVHIAASYRADLVVEEQVLVELKAVDALLPVHTLQTITYMKLSRLPVALLINFNVPLLKSGIRRFANTPQPALET